MSRKKSYLVRNDHHIDIGPAGRNLFVSRDKQIQERAARKIKFFMRVVIALVVICAAVAFGFFLFGYLVPYFHSQFILPETSASSEPSDDTVEIPTPVFDAQGLPVFTDDINLFIVNANSPADADFVPELKEDEDILFNANIVDAVRALKKAAEDDGLVLEFSKGYVSYEEQEELFDEKVEEMKKEEGLTAVMAKNEAMRYVSMPGQCDDQSGMCLTLRGDSETFKKSKIYQWLSNNMGKYGFVFRYPEYKEDYTGRVADLTVIRYVGSQNAETMRRLSMCVEEYTAYLAQQ